MANQTMFQTLYSESHLLNAWKDIKNKGSVGGIDGQSLADFEKDLGDNILEIIERLKCGRWSPMPYKQIEIPKKVSEVRRIGLLSIKDKIVQHGIKMLIEPRMEKIFVGNSYGYRPNKGALKAIRRALQERQNKKTPWILRLDIDNYFDNIDHQILQSRIKAIVPDVEIVRLIMLCVKMGVVTKEMKWEDTTKGLPQGAVLSPVLANLYLHSFDQFVLSRKLPYVRYADDFIILCHDKEEAEHICIETTSYLKDKLRATLNTPAITELCDGFEFLGIFINHETYFITERKYNDILQRINSFNLINTGLDKTSQKKWKGIKAYYGELLTESMLKSIDDALLKRLYNIIEMDWSTFPNKNSLSKSLWNIGFLSSEYRLKGKEIRNGLIWHYLEMKKASALSDGEKQNRSIIAKRKREFKKREIENSELIVSTPGTLISYNSLGITVKKQGLILFRAPASTLKHITIMSEGVMLSSNLLNYTLQNKIPVDIFSPHGEHLGTFLNASSMQCRLWELQASTDESKRNTLAAEIIEGKVSNQLNLVKYYNKYHKTINPQYDTYLKAVEVQVQKCKKFIRGKEYHKRDFIENLMGHEAQVAIRYWDYIRFLLSDDGICFEERTQQGATDLVNSMLNYGYAILYARVWQALLYAQLNPYDSVIHVRQPGKPTFSYDFIELFRCQAVDRVVISMLQKGEHAEIKDGLLTEDTKKLLVRNITERMYKRENYRGENLPFETIIRRQAKEIADFFEDNSGYKPYKAKW